MDKDFEYYKSLPPPELSVRARKRENKIFREIFGSSHIPHPEVDNCYERTISKIARKINIIKYKLGIDK